MARVIAICLAFAFAFSLVNCATEEITSSNILVVQNVTDYLQENPDAKELEQLVEEPLARGPTPRLRLTYKIGGRIRGKNNEIQ